jgi:hypothetical protein
MADEPMQEAADDAVATPLASPNLLLVLRDAQAQHGLRHNDYARYRCAAAAAAPPPTTAHGGTHADAPPSPRTAARQYCARRLRRLYKMLNFTHGGVKHRFQNRVLTAADVTDGRCVTRAALRTQPRRRDAPATPGRPAFAQGSPN